MSALSDGPPPYGTIAFDCDSTLASIEGIEALAALDPNARLSDEFERLTRMAMEGELPLEAVYGKRLAMVRPSRADLERVGRLYVDNRLTHARELVGALHFLGKHVAIVSGGIRQAVLVLGRALGFDDADVHAVDVHFDAAGDYAGFDERSPLARAGGKVDVVRELAGRPGAGGVALVGDGATDLEAAPAVERFVAYGGVERRASVFAAARAHCESPDLAHLVPLLLAPDEIESLRTSGEHAALVRACEAPTP